MLAVQCWKNKQWHTWNAQSELYKMLVWARNTIGMAKAFYYEGHQVGSCCFTFLALWLFPFHPIFANQASFVMPSSIAGPGKAAKEY